MHVCTDVCIYFPRISLLHNSTVDKMENLTVKWHYYVQPAPFFFFFVSGDIW